MHNMFSSANGRQVPLFETSPSVGASYNGDRGRRRLYEDSSSQPSFVGARAATYEEEPVFTTSAELLPNNYYDSGQADNNEDGFYYDPHDGTGSLHRQHGRSHTQMGIIIALLVLLLGWLSGSFPSANVQSHSSPMSSPLDLMTTILPGISHFITSGVKKEQDNESEEDGPRLSSEDNPLYSSLSKSREHYASATETNNTIMSADNDDALPELSASSQGRKLEVQAQNRSYETDLGAKQRLDMISHDPRKGTNLRNEVMFHLHEDIVSEFIEKKELAHMAEEEYALEAEKLVLRNDDMPQEISTSRQGRKLRVQAQDRWYETDQSAKQRLDTISHDPRKDIDLRNEVMSHLREDSVSEYIKMQELRDMAAEAYALEAEESGLRNDAKSHLREDIVSEHISVKEVKALAEEELMLEAEDVGLKAGLRNRVLSNLREEMIIGDIEMQEIKDLTQEELMLGVELRIWRPKADEVGLRNESMSHLREDIVSEHIGMKELKAMAEEELMLEAEDAGLRVGLRNRVMSNLREEVITEHIEMQELRDLAEEEHSFEAEEAKLRGKLVSQVSEEMITEYIEMQELKDLAEEERILEVQARSLEQTLQEERRLEALIEEELKIEAELVLDPAEIEMINELDYYIREERVFHYIESLSLEEILKEETRLERVLEEQECEIEKKRAVKSDIKKRNADYQAEISLLEAQLEEMEAMLEQEDILLRNDAKMRGERASQLSEEMITDNIEKQELKDLAEEEQVLEAQVLFLQQTLQDKLKLEAELEVGNSLAWV